MNQFCNSARAHMPAATVDTNSTQAMSWSTVGFDYATVNLLMGTHSTSGETLRTVKISESDTETAASSQTAIVAFTGTTSATSATAGFTLPAVAVSGPGAVYVFDIDLKGRKKYMGLSVTPGSTTVNISALVTLSKAEQSRDTTATKQVTNLAATGARGCGLYIEG